MEENKKCDKFHYAYSYEVVFGLISVGIFLVIAEFTDANHMFFAWLSFMLVGWLTIYLLKRRMEKDLEKHFGKEKTRLIYTVGVYWLEGGLFMLAMIASLFYIVLKMNGKL